MNPVTLLALATITLGGQDVCNPEREKLALETVSTINAETVFLKVRDAVRGSVYFHPGLWRALDAEGKETYTRVAAVWVNCIQLPKVKDDKGKPFDKMDSFRITVYDMQSGKKLASIGIFRGFRVEGGR